MIKNMSFLSLGHPPDLVDVPLELGAERLPPLGDWSEGLNLITEGYEHGYWLIIIDNSQITKKNEGGGEGCHNDFKRGLDPPEFNVNPLVFSFLGLCSLHF